MSSCPNIKEAMDQVDPNLYSLFKEYEPLGQFVEEHLDCTGICDPIPFYMFSDINRGVPKNNVYNFKDQTLSEGCKQRIEKLAYQIRDITWFSSIIAGSIVLVNLIMAWSLCCCCKKKNEEEENDENNIN